MSDAVHNPSHYERNGLTCARVIEAMLTPEEQIGYWWGCVQKYLWRWPYKHKKKAKKIEDIDKAIECLERLKSVLYCYAVTEDDADGQDS